jgi:FkbM family methyltransferase
VYAFEPATRAYGAALEKLRDDPNVTLYDEELDQRLSVELFGAALGKQDGTTTLYDCMRDGANTFVPAEGEPSEDVSLVDAAMFVESMGDVALMHLNAEGGELDILERLMDTGLIERARMIMTQWHPYDAETSARIERVIERLAETHRQDNRYYAWNFWMRKDGDAEKATL